MRSRTRVCLISVSQAGKAKTVSISWGAVFVREGLLFVNVFACARPLFNVAAGNAKCTRLHICQMTVFMLSIPTAPGVQTGHRR